MLSKKNGANSSAESARKENSKARTWMDEKSVRKSHGHHIPPAKGMGERALLLLGLLSLLTAADEVCHADAQHRATSNPSEGHAVETGQRKAGPSCFQWLMDMTEPFAVPGVTFSTSSPTASVDQFAIFIIRSA